MPLALDRELTEMYSFARKYTYYPFLGRFKHERLDEGIYKLAKQLPGVVLELEVEAEQYEKAPFGAELQGQQCALQVQLPGFSVRPAA